MTVFPLMLIGHALADYPLQGDWLSKAKNPTLELVPGEVIWPMAMACHCAIHAGAVLLFTRKPILAAAEFFAHFAIYYAKCRGRIGYNADQTLHVVCKFMWAAIFGWMTL